MEWLLGIVVILLVLALVGLLHAMAGVDEFKTKLDGARVSKADTENTLDAVRVELHIATTSLRSAESAVRYHESESRKAADGQAAAERALAEATEARLASAHAAADYQRIAANYKQALDNLREIANREYIERYRMGERYGYRRGLREGLTDPRGDSGKFTEWSEERKAVLKLIEQESEVNGGKPLQGDHHNSVSVAAKAGTRRVTARKPVMRKPAKRKAAADKAATGKTVTPRTVKGKAPGGAGKGASAKPRCKEQP